MPSSIESRSKGGISISMGIVSMLSISKELDDVCFLICWWPNRMHPVTNKLCIYYRYSIFGPLYAVIVASSPFVGPSKKVIRKQLPFAFDEHDLEVLDGHGRPQLEKTTL